MQSHVDVVGDAVCLVVSALAAGLEKALKTPSLLVVVVIGVVMWASPSSACSCGPNGESIVEDANRALVVFSGRVASIDAPEHDRACMDRSSDHLVMMEVDQVWRGCATRAQAVYTISSCTFLPSVGDDVVVFAYRWENGSLSGFTLCDPEHDVGSVREALGPSAPPFAVCPDQCQVLDDGGVLARQASFPDNPVGCSHVQVSTSSTWMLWTSWMSLLFLPLMPRKKR